MKKFIFFVLIIALHASYSAYGQKVNQIIKKERGVLYVVDRGWDYVVNTNVVTVKPISHNSVIDPTLKVLNIDPSGYIDIQVPQGKDIQGFVEELKQSKQFESVEYNTYGTLCMTPNDTYYSQQSYLDTINAPSAWDITTGNPNIKVAVIDSGIEVAHSDIGYGSNTYSNVSLTEGANYTNGSNTHISPVNSHGTNVAGIIGAKTNNSKGIAGICGGNNSSGVTMIPYCVTNGEPIANTNVRTAIYDAIDAGVKVINMSLRLSEDYATNACLDYAYNHNVCIVCSAGNNENGGTSGIYYPASYSKTIAVGAKDSTNARWINSQYGQGLDLVAPGVTIKTTDINNSYTNLDSGTSLSAPQVTGTIALMLSVNPLLTPDEIKSVLHNTCTKLTSYTYNSLGWNEHVGYGLLNVFKAVFAVKTYTISGQPYICNSSTATYTINNLPSVCSVNWYLSDGFGPTAPTLQSSGSTCTITNNLTSSYMGTLHADIYYQGTLQKSCQQQIVAYGGFYGLVTTTNQQFSPSSPVWVTPGNTVTLKSPNLVQKNVSYSVVNPSAWQYYASEGGLTVGYPSGSSAYQPIVISIQNNTLLSDCDNSYQILIMPTTVLPHYQIQAGGDNGNIMVELTTETDEEAKKVIQAYSIPIEIEQNPTWTLEVFDAASGTKLITKNVTGTSAVVATGKSRGVFVVRATIGKEVLSEKVVLK